MLINPKRFQIKNVLPDVCKLYIFQPHAREVRPLTSDIIGIVELFTEPYVVSVCLSHDNTHFAFKQNQVSFMPKLTGKKLLKLKANDKS